MQKKFEQFLLKNNKDKDILYYIKTNMYISEDDTTPVIVGLDEKGIIVLDENINDRTRVFTSYIDACNWVDDKLSNSCNTIYPEVVKLDKENY